MNFSSSVSTPSKAELRLEMKARRLSLNESQKARASWKIFNHLQHWLDQTPPCHDEAVGVYLARPFEIALDGLIEELLRAHYRVCAPRVQLETQSIAFWHLESLEKVENGPWNVPEPLSQVKMTPRIVFVPGLAFDERGQRLGTGGGWYDRVLTPEMIKIGVCLENQIVPEVPCEAHDCAMDFVVSPNRFIRCAQGQS